MLKRNIQEMQKKVNEVMLRDVNSMAIDCMEWNNKKIEAKEELRKCQEEMAKSK